MAHPTKFTPERKAAYVLALERTGEVSSASAAVSIHRQTVYEHMRNDPQFEIDCQMALGRLGEAALSRLKHLAIDGVLEQTFDKEGNVVRERRVYSERLLLRLIERHMDPWKPAVKVDGVISGQIDHQHTARISPKDLDLNAQNHVRALLDALPAPSHDDDEA